ncbi:MAG TPA: LytTR family DNA-binding domain-containing protein [Gemmatimonadaceae bacterium]|nr:LytTR family DNA-binding domain-containing protein [Gemmatimonadaceae bacterium]
MTGTDRPLRVLIADDEPLARQRLEDLLAAEPRVQLVGSVDNGRAAVEAIRDHAPDLVFLDVQMPGLTGLEVVREIGAERMPATVFVTAYDQHAVAAFELAATDYLVKPFDDERFEQAFRRARRAVDLEEVGRLSVRLRELLGEEGGSARRAPASPAVAYLERVAVDMRGQLKVVPVSEIDFITASGPYAELHVGPRRYIIRERMQTLEDRLDPAHFLRIHRSAIVRLDLIETLHRGAGGDYAVQLKGGVRLKVSRSRFEELEKRMGFVR